MNEETKAKVLAEYLDALQRGDLALEDLLERYPDEEWELSSLLEIGAGLLERGRAARAEAGPPEPLQRILPYRRPDQTPAARPAVLAAVVALLLVSFLSVWALELRTGGPGTRRASGPSVAAVTSDQGDKVIRAPQRQPSVSQPVSAPTAETGAPAQPAGSSTSESNHDGSYQAVSDKQPAGQTVMLIGMAPVSPATTSSPPATQPKVNPPISPPAPDKSPQKPPHPSPTPAPTPAPTPPAPLPGQGPVAQPAGSPPPAPSATPPADSSDDSDSGQGSDAQTHSNGNGKANGGEDHGKHNGDHGNQPSRRESSDAGREQD